jgi:pyruvate/2-oxoacid:ferredoxin oxidoreductase beta subunit
MDKFALYVPQLLPFKEHFLPEAHRACMGCGIALGVRQTYKALEEKAEWMEGAHWEVPFKQPLPGSLIKGTKEAQEETRPALLQIEKDDQARLLICFDNEAVKTKPTPAILKKAFPAAAVARGFHYVATACPSYPFDLIDKVRRGMESEGDSYLHILSPCPVGWDFESEFTVQIGRFAVESAIFPLYEVITGSPRLTIDHPKIRPVEQYIHLQNRFNHFKKKEILAIQAEVDSHYTKLQEGKL